MIRRRVDRPMMTHYDDVMRTIIQLPDDQLEGLAALCEREGISRAEAIRRAIAAWLKEEAVPTRNEAQGLWRDRGVGALALEDELRGEWDRGGASDS